MRARRSSSVQLSVLRDAPQRSDCSAPAMPRRRRRGALPEQWLPPQPAAVARVRMWRCRCSRRRAGAKPNCAAMPLARCRVVVRPEVQLPRALVARRHDRLCEQHPADAAPPHAPARPPARTMRAARRPRHTSPCARTPPAPRPRTPESPSRGRRRAVGEGTCARPAARARRRAWQHPEAAEAAPCAAFRAERRVRRDAYQGIPAVSIGSGAPARYLCFSIVVATGCSEQSERCAGQPRLERRYAGVSRHRHRLRRPPRCRRR